MSSSGVAVRIGRDVPAKTKFDVKTQTLLIVRPEEAAKVSFGARVLSEPDAQSETFLNLSVKTRYGLEQLRDAISAYLAAGGDPQAELEAAYALYADPANRSISIAPGTPAPARRVVSIAPAAAASRPAPVAPAVKREEDW